MKHTVNFSELDPVKPAHSGPPAYASQSLPYQKLDDRRFEELVFQLFQKKIEREPGFRARHSRVQLMQGVGEKGRDAALFEGGRFSGIIQCKNYQSSLSAKQCLRELVKPLLHDAIGNISIPTSHPFDYFLVASGGFNEAANKMLSDLNRYILAEESEFIEVIKGLKKDYKAFANVDYLVVRPQLLELLATLNVHQYWPSDLDRELLETGSESLLSAFFTLRSVTDNSTISELAERIDAQQTILPQTILDRFVTASLQLTEYQSTLHDAARSHIPRSETGQIITWIQNPPQDSEEHVLLLVGEPGSGKTVILKDVYEALRREQIPVVAFKADRYYVDSVQDLQRKADLPASLEDSVRKLLETYSNAVVLIDQIDALSQSVTSRRDYIDAYGQIISRIKNINGARVVVSIRKFELEYDDEFAHYRNKYQKVIVHPLSRPEVVAVLAGLGVPENALSEKLYQLLCIPNQLNIFCKVQAGAINLTSLVTLQDLYAELWQQRVSSQSESSIVLEKALFAFAGALHQQQVLSLPKSIFPEPQALEDAIRAGLVVEQSGYVQFFHQTFFDFVFAKAFLVQGQSVEAYLRKTGQSIFVRPSVKMILGFLREQNHENYVRLIRKLLVSKWVRWHIKSLIINLLAFEQTPSKQEIRLVESDILVSSRFRYPFLEAVRSGDWLPVLIGSGEMTRLLMPEKKEGMGFSIEFITKWWSGQRFRWLGIRKPSRPNPDYPVNLWGQILHVNLPDNRHRVLEYLVMAPDFERKPAVVLRLLWAMKIWDNEAAKTLFLANASADSDLEHQVDILEEAADYDPQWALTTLWNSILQPLLSSDKPRNSMLDHRINEFGEKILQKIPVAFFATALGAVRMCLSRMSKDHSFTTENGIVREWPYEFFDYRRREQAYGKDWALHAAIAGAEDLCKTHEPAFSGFLGELLTESSSTLIRVGLAGLSEAPEHFPQEAFLLLERLIPLAGTLDSHLLFHIRNVLPRLFSVLSGQQQRVLGELILALRIPSENRVKEWDGQRHHYKYYGHTAYSLLSAIPEADRNRFPEIRKRFLELQRRYGEIKNDPPHRVTVHSVGAPLPAEAYRVMTLSDWEDSFRRYDQNYDPGFWSHKGGMVEHYRVFETAVSEKPDHFLPLIQKIIKENTVPVDYQLAGLEGLKKADFEPQSLLTLYKQMARRNLDKYTLQRLLWLTEALIKHELVDAEVFRFLRTTALEVSEPSEYLNPEHPESDAVNTLKGVAVYQLAHCSYKEEFAEAVLDVLDVISASANQPVRVSALMHLAYYLQWNPARVKELFKKLIKPEDHREVYQVGIYTAQYLAKHDFAATAPFLKAALVHEPCRRDAAIILGVAFLTHQEGSLQILQDAWKQYPETRAAMVDVALANLADKDTETRRKAEWLYTKFLIDTDKDTVHEYNTSFLRMEAASFTRLLPLFKKYAHSPVGAKAPGYFFEYLLKCCREYPAECIALLQPLIRHEPPVISSSRYYERDKPVRVLVAAYNSLFTEPVKNKRHLQRALQLFDELLRHPVFRGTVESVLDVV